MIHSLARSWRFVALVFVTGLLSLESKAGNTSVFRGDPAHTGVYRSTAPGNLNVKWTFQTGEAIVSSPTVAGDTVYVGSSDNFLYAVDAGTGKQKWKFDAHGNVGSSPAVSGDTVFVVSMDGKLYAVNAATGAQ